jgi:hypothetical protein
MEDLYFNLASEEFSKPRKILIWIVAFITLLLSMWISYLKFFKQDSSADMGLTLTLYAITLFMFSLAILATIKRKEHYFKVDDEIISYRYGLIFPTQKTHLWTNIKKIYVPPHSKNTSLELKDKKIVHINLTWVERNKARIIRKHIFYNGRDKGIEIAKSHYKKK